MLENISVKLFGKIVEPRIDSFDQLKLSLRKADMKTGVYEYVCNLLFLMLISFMVSILSGTLLITFLIPTNPGYVYTLGIIVSFIVSGGTFALGYYYPGMISGGIKNKIEKNLPFAVFYMTTSASAGINPIDIFRLLGERGGIIGERAHKIYNNVKTFGMPLSAALQKEATKTPSTMFSDLLWGMLSIITTGGDLEEYLVGKTRLYMSHYKRLLTAYANSLSLYTEIYITLMIVGSLLFIILTSIMAPVVGGGVLLIQTFLVFLFIPMVSIAFVVVIKGMSPTD